MAIEIKSPDKNVAKTSMGGAANSLKCAHCGSAIQSDWAACPKCGEKIGSSVSVAEHKNTDYDSIDGFAIAGLCCGIASIPVTLFILAWLGIAMAIMGIVFGSIANHRKRGGKKLASAGITCGIVSIAVYIAIIVGTIIWAKWQYDRLAETFSNSTYYDTDAIGQHIADELRSLGE